MRKKLSPQCSGFLLETMSGDTWLVGRAWSGEVLLAPSGWGPGSCSTPYTHRTAPQARLSKPNGKTTETERMCSNQIRMEVNDGVGWGPQGAHPNDLYE